MCMRSAATAARICKSSRVVCHNIISRVARVGVTHMFGIDFETMQALSYAMLFLVLLDMISLPVIAIALCVRRFK